MFIIVSALSARSDSDIDPDQENTNRGGGAVAGGGAPVTDHILYLISDLQTMTCSLIGQDAGILGPHWSGDNEGCPHGTPGLTGHRAERRYLI